MPSQPNIPAKTTTPIQSPIRGELEWPVVAIMLAIVTVSDVYKMNVTSHRRRRGVTKYRTTDTRSVAAARLPLSVDTGSSNATVLSGIIYGNANKQRMTNATNAAVSAMRRCQKRVINVGWIVLLCPLNLSGFIMP